MGMMIAPHWFADGADADGVLAYLPAPESNVFDVQGMDLSGYQRFVIHLAAVTVDTNDTTLLLKFYMDGALVSANYAYSYSNLASDGGSGASSNASASALQLIHLQDTGANLAYSARIEVSHPVAAVTKLVIADGNYTNTASDVGKVLGSGTLPDNGEITGVRIEGSSGLITGGSCMILAFPTS